MALAVLYESSHPDAKLTAQRYTLVHLLREKWTRRPLPTVSSRGADSGQPAKKRSRKTVRGEPLTRSMVSGDVLEKPGYSWFSDQLHDDPVPSAGDETLPSLAEMLRQVPEQDMAMMARVEKRLRHLTVLSDEVLNQMSELYRKCRELGSVLRYEAVLSAGDHMVTSLNEELEKLAEISS